MIVQLLTSFTGALGFCLVFHLRRRYMFAASLGGLLTCGVYLAAASIWSGILLPTLTAAAFAALYAEFLAWFMGAPATLFLIPALLIPLVPGRPLYYAMYYAVQQDMDLSADFARQTALYALGIALGASLVWALGNVKKCAVGKHPKSEKLGSTGQAACCARIHSRYFTGGNPSGLRV